MDVQVEEGRMEVGLDVQQCDCCMILSFFSQAHVEISASLTSASGLALAVPFILSLVRC